jgi:hypothetical protein
MCGDATEAEKLAAETWGWRGFAYAGETAKARKAFQDFFALWKDADPDIPILQQAKAEYAELR